MKSWLWNNQKSIVHHRHITLPDCRSIKWYSAIILLFSSLITIIAAPSSKTYAYYNAPGGIQAIGNDQKLHIFLIVERLQATRFLPPPFAIGYSMYEITLSTNGSSQTRKLDLPAEIIPHPELDIVSMIDGELYISHSERATPLINGDELTTYKLTDQGWTPSLVTDKMFERALKSRLARKEFSIRDGATLISFIPTSENAVIFWNEKTILINVAIYDITEDEDYLISISVLDAQPEIIHFKIPVEYETVGLIEGNKRQRLRAKARQKDITPSSQDYLILPELIAIRESDQRNRTNSLTEELWQRIGTQTAADGQGMQLTLAGLRFWAEKSELGNLYSTLQDLEKQAMQDDAQAAWLLALGGEFNYFSLPRHKQYSWYVKAADASINNEYSAAAQYRLGRFFYRTNGISQPQLAAYWFARSLAQGIGEAEIYLETLGVSSQTTTPESDPITVVTVENWPQLLRQAQNGCPRSQYHVGRTYYEGKIVDKDLNEALHYLEAAAEIYPEAQYLSGIIYLDKSFAKHDIPSAIYWLERSVKANNNPAASYRLGLIYHYGSAVIPKDQEQAQLHFEQASQDGSAKATEFLKKHYDNDDKYYIKRQD